MGAREKNAIQSLSMVSALALSIFLSSQTQGWGQNTPDPFAPDYVAPSVPVATPKAPAHVAPALPAKPPLPAVPTLPAKTAPALEKTVTQAPPTPKPVPSLPETTIAPPLTTAEKPGVTESDSSFLDKLSNLFSSEDAEETRAKKQPAQTVKEAPVKNPPPVKRASSVKEVVEPTVTPSPQTTVRAATTNDPFSPASVSPAKPTVVPTSPPPVMPSQPEPVEAPRMVVEVDPQKNTPSFLDRLSNFFSEKAEKKTEPTPAQAVAQKVDQPIVKPEPELEPKPEPEAKPAPSTSNISAPAPEEPGFFEQIGQALTAPFSSEKEDQDTSSPQAEKQPQPDRNVIEKKEPAQDTSPTQSIPEVLDPRLKKAKLGLGKDILLGQGDNQLGKQAKCFTKQRGTIAFCTNPTRWPAPIARHFQVSTHLYKGVRGIIKFDGAIATRLYAIFNSDGFDEVVQYFENQYGPATNTFDRHTRLLKENISNKSYIWRKPNPDEGLVEVMEIRQFSDMRGPRPDLAHSTIRLYFEGSRAIFSMTSDLDFMHLR